jgi:exosortase
VKPLSRRLELLALAGVVAGLAALYFRPFVDLVGIWFVDGNVSHSFLLLPVMLYLVWQRRGRLAATERHPSSIGLVVVIVSLGALLLGTAGVEFFIMRTSAVGVIAGSILFLAGWRWLRILAFPLALSFLVIPIPPVIFFQMTFPLQVMASKVGVAALRAFEIPVYREGNVIWLAHTALEVTEACSGIRSLLSLFSVALLYAYFSESRFLARAVITLSSVPIAILANGIRIAGTGLAAHYIGPETATGFFHAFQGWMMYIVSLAMLMAVAAVVKKLGKMASAAVARPSLEPSLS